MGSSSFMVGLRGMPVDERWGGWHSTVNKTRESEGASSRKPWCPTSACFMATR